MTIFITGGAGFIGSNFVHTWLSNNKEEIVNLDALTYAGNLENISKFDGNNYHTFIHGDITNTNLYEKYFYEKQIRAIINFAAESHVDRSIDGPESFIETNIFGTYKLLEAAKKYWLNLDNNSKKDFKFMHISTDEVYGSLKLDEKPFTEESRYKPNSPYSASKASSDHLVRAYNITYGLPTIISNCSNNYGPYQYPEKLIPLIINNAIREMPLPIYGDGKQIRDWLYVEDHCNAIIELLSNGKSSEVFNIGGNNEITNIQIVNIICKILDEIHPRKEGKNYSELITHVSDRPGHDRRYAINFAKIRSELNWSPSETFDTGIYKTVVWNLNNQEWINNIYTKINRGNS